MNLHERTPALDPMVARDATLRQRNRRVGLALAIAFIALVLLCAAYIGFLGGANKPPMKPFHVERTTTESISIA